MLDNNPLAFVSFSGRGGGGERERERGRGDGGETLVDVVGMNTIGLD